MPKYKTLPIRTLGKLERLLDKEDQELTGSLSDQINALSDVISTATRGSGYIFANSGNLRGAFSPDYTPTTATKALNDMIARLKIKRNTLRALQQQEINFANRIIIPDDSGVFAGNGQFYVQFVNVGLGDCTLITTPKGVKIMVDCGSDALSDVTSLIPGYNEAVNGTPEFIIGNAIKSKVFLNSTSVIDILILSHPDADHHNKLETILSTVKGISVNVVYFGGADTVDVFTSSAYIKEIAGTTKATLRKVTLNENPFSSTVTVEKDINDETITATTGTPNKLSQEFIDPVTGEIVLYYEDGASDFRLSVLASDVTGVWQKNKFVANDSDIKTAKEMKLNATLPNKRSLVAKASCFGQNILVCGDATAVTEKFMLTHFATSLTTIQTLRLGHHGSATSSSVAFVNALTAMTTAIASTSGQTTTLHSLPKEPIMSLFVPKVPGPAAKHNIWAFNSDDAKAVLYFKDITAQLYATGSNDTISYAKAKSTVDVLQEIF